MRCRMSGSLAAALLLVVASNLCPASRPNDTTHNVGVGEILAPRGTVDSGRAITPRCVVTNYGDSTADLWTHLAIDAGGRFVYTESLWLSGLAPAQQETVSFHLWTPQGRDSATAIAWTECDGDTFPQNDTCRQGFLIRVTDIAIVAIIKPVPDTTYDSGVTFYPQCRVWDYGNNQWDTIIVRFRIGRYTSACTLYQGHSDTATAHDPYTTFPGLWNCRAFALVAGDLHPENNVMVDTFTVTGNILKDVEAVAVLSPDTVESLGFFVPRTRICNNGAGPAAFKSFFIIQHASGAVIREDSAVHLLGPGDTTDMTYQVCGLGVGIYYAAESVFMADDQKSINDVVRKRFRYGPRLYGDIGIVKIIPPRPDSAFQPTAVWKNYSDHRMSFTAFCFMYNKYGARIYSSSIPDKTLEGGEQDTLFFPEFNPGIDTIGWAIFCSTAAGGDTNPVNDTMWYPRRPGIEEGQPQASSHKLQATVLSRLPPGAVAFDAMGRRVLNPRAGICFVCEEPQAVGGRPSAVRIRRIVILR